jgi:hypothetical protein
MLLQPAQLANAVFMKKILVYSHDANPAIDAPKFATTRHDADARVERGGGCYVAFNKLQLAPPRLASGEIDQRLTLSSGLFGEAWAPRPSDHYIVMQMRSSSDDQTGGSAT